MSGDRKNLSSKILTSGDGENLSSKIFRKILVKEKLACKDLPVELSIFHFIHQITTTYDGFFNKSYFVCVAADLSTKKVSHELSGGLCCRKT